MLGLLYKDILANKSKFILLSVGMAVIAAIVWLLAVLDNQTIDKEMFDNENSFVMSSICAYICLFFSADSIGSALFVTDERKNWAAMIISTPFAAKGQVKSKYLEVLLILYAVSNFCFFTDLISGAITELGGLLGNTIMMLFWGLLFLKAVEMPFVVYFGSKNGNNIKIVITLVIIFAALIYGLFGDISMFESDDFLVQATNLLTGELSLKLMIITSAVVPAVSVGAYYISYRISCRLYSKGAMNYDG